MKIRRKSFLARKKIKKTSRSMDEMKSETSTPDEFGGLNTHS
jgi:hypothetical protein